MTSWEIEQIVHGNFSLQLHETAILNDVINYLKTLQNGIVVQKQCAFDISCLFLMTNCQLETVNCNLTNPTSFKQCQSITKACKSSL